MEVCSLGFLKGTKKVLTVWGGESVGGDLDLACASTRFALESPNRRNCVCCSSQVLILPGMKIKVAKIEKNTCDYYLFETRRIEEEDSRIGQPRSRLSDPSNCPRSRICAASDGKVDGRLHIFHPIHSRNPDRKVVKLRLSIPYAHKKDNHLLFKVPNISHLIIPSLEKGTTRHILF